MSHLTKSIAMAAMLAMAASAALLSEAAGTPSASGAKATNTMIANATLAEAPNPESREVHIKIDGQVTSPSHKLGPRRCRVSRTIHIANTRLDGSVVGGDTYPTNKGGHFSTETSVEYDSDVPSSGGTVTFTLSTSKATVGKDKLGFRSFTCRALALSVQVDVPPQPTSG